MKSFSIKTSLACGLTHRLDKLDAQVVVDATGWDPVEAIRRNQAVIRKINLINHVFIDAVDRTEKRKRAIFEELQEKYKKDSDGLATEEQAKMGRNLTAEYSKRAAVVQQESTAQPDEVITVTLSEDDYEKVLLPVFKKTVQTWDVNGDGGGQKLFLEVAEALEHAVDV